MTREVIEDFWIRNILAIKYSHRKGNTEKDNFLIKLD